MDAIVELKACAKAASDNAYAPYSKFSVGAALITSDGSLFTGCNVENASYGLSICAERNAIFKMVSAGHRKLRMMVIYTPTMKPTAPCGACRQVIYEFGTGAEIISFCDGDEVLTSSIKELLPGAFSLNPIS